MAKDAFIYIYRGNCYEEIRLISSNQVGIVAVESLLFKNMPEGWSILSQGKGSLFYNSSPIKEKLLQDMDVFILDSQIILVAQIITQQEEPLVLDLSRYSSLVFGKKECCDIICSNKLVSGEHFMISLRGNTYFIEDLNSTNGTYLNGKKLTKPVPLQDRDSIHAYCGRLVYENGQLSIQSCNKEIHIQSSKVTPLKQNNPAPYPFFSRPPRLFPPMPKGELEIQNPPPKPSNPGTSLIALVLPPAIMGCITVFTALFAGRYGLMSLAFTGGTLLVSLINFLSQKQKYFREMNLRKTKYLEYIDKQHKVLQQLIQQQKNAEMLIHPDFAYCLSRVEGLDRQLWERTPQDDDFLLLRLGMGTNVFNMKIKTPRQELVIEHDPLLDEPQRLANTYAQIQEVPICLPLYKCGTAGLVGHMHNLLPAALNLVLQISVHHSPDEVKIIPIFRRDDRGDWLWMRWLPHVWYTDVRQRYLAEEGHDLHQFLCDLHDLLKERELRKLKTPQLVFIITDLAVLEGESILAYLSKNNPDLGVSILYLAQGMEQLPKDCAAIVEVDGKLGQMLCQNKSDMLQFNPDFISPGQAELLARKMAPIRLKKVSQPMVLPQSITLLDLYNATTVDALDAGNRWETNKSVLQLSAPLGIRTGGELLTLDLHEKGWGPHGLIAGTTGSGKSELLQSLIVSLAINYAPYDIAFVLIDYKGGGMANAFRDLPHLVGTITNLDGKETRRALVSIKSELKRRQALLASCNLNHIDQYTKLYKEGTVKEPLPHLILISDEFAELKMEQPDFMRELVSAARVGRSLGVHLILATQKPTGIVDDQIWSNARFRLCLKVQSPEDSQEIIKCPDAAMIKNPGRAYIQVGNGEAFEMLQSAWSGADYHPASKQENSVFSTINLVKLDGTRQELLRTVEENTFATTTQLQAVVQYLHETAEKKGLKSLKGPWLPPLPERVLLQDLNATPQGWLCPVIGLLDIPEKQLQEPLLLDLGKEGNLLVYGAPGYGKTTFLQTLAFSLAYSHTPEEINLYIMDFGGRTLDLFKALPHCGGVVMPDQDEKLARLFRFLQREIESRKCLFAQYGVGSLPGYQEAAGEKMPAIIVLLDNYAAFAESWQCYEEAFNQLCREGGSLGIHMVVTTTGCSSIRYKTASNFKLTVALSLPEKSEYQGIVGRTGGLEPAPICGRGLVKGNPPLEFQTALPAAGETEAERSALLRSALAQLAAKWSGPKARPIPVMPEILSLSSFCSYYKVKSQLPIGLDNRDLEPVYINLERMPNLLVTGDMQHGKTNFLRSLITMLTMQYTPQELQLHLVDSAAKAFLPHINQPYVAHYCSSSEALDKLAHDLSSLADNKRQQQETKPSIMDLVFIDDLNDFLRISTASIKELLERLIKRERNLGFSVILGGMTSDIGSSWEPFVKSLKELQTGFHFGNINEQQVFNARLPFHEAPKDLHPGDAFYITRGRFLRLRTPMHDD